MNWGMIAFWVWLIGIPLSVLPIARALLVAFGEERPSRADYYFAAWIGVVASTMWPVALAGAIVVQRLRAERPADEREGKR